MKKVQVLMSTYNGAPFIAQQIESILNQSHLDTSIYIRDDGSSDDTMRVLKEYATIYPERIHYVLGTNTGVIRSFLYLLEQADTFADYYCFCDQDDVWLPNKIERAVKKLEVIGTNVPAMISTATQMTDSKLMPTTMWPKDPLKKPSFYNALIQNIAVGSTVTLNKHARDLLCSRKVSPDQLLMHDWWAYLCVSAFGNYYFDPEPSILYRQHANNVVGGEAFFADKLKKKWKSFQKHKGKRLLSKQAMEFHRLYGSELDNVKKQQLELFLAQRNTIRQRFIFLTSSKLYRNSYLEQLLFRILIMIGYI